MFGALKRGRFRSLASLIGLLVVNVVGELHQKRTLAASRGFLAAARLSCTVSKLTTKISVWRWSDMGTYRRQNFLAVNAPMESAPIVYL